MDARQAMIGATVAGVLAAGGGFVMVGTANAATVATTGTVSAMPSDDTYTSSTRKAVNFGTAPKLVVGSSDGETRVSYLKFTTPALPPGATVTGATLNLPVEDRPAAATLRVYLTGTAWTEAKVTATTAPALAAAITSIEPAGTDSTLKLDVSKLVTKAGTYAFALKSAATAAVTRFRSAENGAGGPQLQIKYTVKAAPTSAKPTTSEPCVTDALLVPSCGVLWGAAAGGFTSTPRDTALKNWEDLTGRTATIYHTYHKGDETFPTAAEIAMTEDPAHPRVLLLNWKVAYGTSWAQVAAGAKDARIDKWAAYVKATYGTKKFFLALHHEPENDVNPAAGSGMTAADYAAMYRHVILRLRADGVTNAINVVAYMGNEKWMAQSWWKDLYPGDDVVDWVGLDSYVSVEKGYYHYGDFGDLLDRQPTGGGLGFYDWATRTHPGKPLMVAEWGMYHRVNYPTAKSAAFATVLPELKTHPGIKAIAYFDTASDNSGDRDISVNSLPSSLTAFRTVAANPIFNVRIGQ
jgi:beta-mannanase